jgi:hypothetical protein
MLGFGPVPEGAAVPAPHVYSAPVPGALLAVLGVTALALLALMPATFDVGWLPLALIGLPLAVGGACGVLMGYAVLSMRIEIAQDGALIAAPGLRACPVPPVRQYRLRWTDVRAVHRRTELYRSGPLRLPLETYAIETADGFIRFGSYYLSDLEPVLIELAHRADRPWCEDDEVEVGLLRTLLCGAPPWPTVDRRPPAARAKGGRPASQNVTIA